ncbi:hypothetical protein OAG31_02750, partial [Akkermansiaceae bacterium]|nr:hypothetical protein [Akkermansiaceae bacterium]
MSYTSLIWLLAILINRYYGVETLGQYSSIQAIVSPMAIIFHLQMKVCLTIEKEVEKTFTHFINLFAISQLLFLIVILSVAYFLNQPILFISYAIFKIFESLNFVVQGYFQSNNKFDKAFNVTLLKIVLMIFSMLLVLSNNYSLLYFFFLTSLLWIIAFICYDYKKIRNDRIILFSKPNFGIIKPLFITGISLSLVNSFDTFLTAIPRYFLLIKFGESELGKFTMILQFFIAATIFIVSVGHPFLVRLKKYLIERDFQSFLKEVKKTSLIFFCVASLFIIVIYFCNEFIMKFAWGKDYVYLGRYLYYSMLGMIPMFLSSILIYSITALKHFSILLKYYPVIIISSILCSWYLIPTYGLLGGVLTIVTVQFIKLVLTLLAFVYCV